MLFLFGEIWLWLVLSFLLGWIAHWLICCRLFGHKHEESGDETNSVAASEASAVAQLANASDAPPAVHEEWKPLGFAQRPDDANDLKRIKGIGGVIEETLHELGVFKFEQIAEWNDDNVAWVDNFLSFPGRIDREDWRSQARALAKGEVTEFAARVDKGDVDY